MIDVTDVLLNKGKVVKYEVPLGLKHLMYRFGNFKVLSSSPVSLTVERTDENTVVLSGSVWLELRMPCARCLEPQAYRMDVSFETETELDKKDYIDGYNLDVDQLVHDEALLVWPDRVLCSADCKGLCSTCGQNLNKGSCNCEQTDVDPRMAKILDIFSNFKEV